MNRAIRILGWILGIVAAIVVIAIASAWLAVRASLPQIEGETALAGLSAPASI